MNRVRPVSEATFQSVPSVSETLGCKNGLPEETGINLPGAEGERAALERRHNVKYIGSASQVCVRVGSRLIISSTPTELDKPILKYLAIGIVKNISTISPQSYPSRLFEEMGLSRDEFLAARSIDLKNPGPNPAILRFEYQSETPDLQDSSLPPRFFPGTLILKYGQLKTLSQSEKIRLIDVRSKAEFAEGTMEKAESFPLTPLDATPTARPWTQTAQGLSRFQFDLNSLVGQRDDRALVIFGNDAADPRSFWALYLIFRSGAFSKVYWLYEGYTGAMNK